MSDKPQSATPAPAAQNNNLAKAGIVVAIVGVLLSNFIVIAIGLALLGLHCLQTPSKKDDPLGWLLLVIAAGIFLLNYL